MSAQHPKNKQEAQEIQEEGVKHQLSQAIDSQETNIKQLKQNQADKSEIEQETNKLDSLKKESTLLQKQ